MQASFRSVRVGRDVAIRVDLGCSWGELAASLTNERERRALVQCLREIPLPDYRLETAEIGPAAPAVLWATPGLRAGGLGPFVRTARVETAVAWVGRMGELLRDDLGSPRWIISDSLSFRFERSPVGLRWEALRPSVLPVCAAPASNTFVFIDHLFLSPARGRK